ncbi:hypothetical protein LOK49_LG10G02215 [Camellia lanceoleosa]|uniref:Uncharacterized protein n=1 Tax=Camellia lanceoleosa TaxID=1840588 RepID=A0ACC0G5J5_9ERIC|nr:hypothetical protein LOK49_LG10G02215 [Camellia lanceoleosa]
MFTSTVGNVSGFKALNALRLENLQIPRVSKIGLMVSKLKERSLRNEDVGSRKRKYSYPDCPFKIEYVSPSTPKKADAELRISHDLKKVLALLTAFVGLFKNHSLNESHNDLGSAEQDPKAILASVAILLGLSAEAHGDAPLLMVQSNMAKRCKKTKKKKKKKKKMMMIYNFKEDHQFRAI